MPVRIELPNPDAAAEDLDVCRRGVQRGSDERRRHRRSGQRGHRQRSTAGRASSPKGEGRFEPRAVKLGRRGEGYAEVTEGLKQGEEVVTSATFLIDAESNLRAALQAFGQQETQAMIAALIRWSARNVFLVGLATIFVTLAGIYAVSRVPLDAIPDLSDVQVIVYTEYPGQAPQVVEDQVTYPLTTAMLTVPKSRVVRGFSFFGVSFVYVIFEDGTDLYWARSRVLEYLSSAARRLAGGRDAEHRT